MLSASIVLTPPAHAVIDHPEKIGIGALSRIGTGPALDDLGFRFYYTWSAQDVPDTQGSVFVPMIDHEEDVGVSVPRTSGHLLGFNEPYRPDQYLSPDRAIALWPRLMAHDLRLGSPSTSPGPSTLGPNSWLNQFITRADARDYRVDFIALHYYSADADVEKFRYFLEKVHAAYGRPIWVTEWTLWDLGRKTHKFTDPEIVEFAKRGSEMLDNLPFVERHMWYKLYYNGTSDMPTQILDKSNNLTNVGRVFQAAVGGADFGYEDIVVPSNLVPDPGFEDGQDAQWHYYWRVNMGQGQVVSGAGHSGARSLKLGTGAAQVSNDISYRTTPGRSYQLTAWTKLDSASEKASIGIKAFDERNAVVSNVKVPITSTTYKNVQLNFTIPANADRIIINIYKDAGASFVHIDDVAVVAN